ncbi:hypothetical protein BDK61_1478 [Haloarcula quadrata]|uniref:Uncharacterized protein n=1 Tax=Haloarcula quadrata TaxID=182779 RepID=A0A495R5M8_9EURY|nr:hypothetical protein [Haloarcula quadrata]RKS82178.1 hypothetical protein BDK61_1478 [Haloarcula quadrata]
MTEPAERARFIAVLAGFPVVIGLLGGHIHSSGLYTVFAFLATGAYLFAVNYEIARLGGDAR